MTIKRKKKIKDIKNVSLLSCLGITANMAFVSEMAHIFLARKSVGIQKPEPQNSVILSYKSVYAKIVMKTDFMI